MKFLKVSNSQLSVKGGSHVKLGRHLSNTRQTLTIPNHKELGKGTIKAIYNQALRYISDEELRKHFYS